MIDAKGSRHGGGGWGLSLESIALNVGTSGIGDDLDGMAIVIAEETVKTIDEVMTGLIEGALGEVMQKRVETFGGLHGKLSLGDG